MATLGIDFGVTKCVTCAPKRFSFECVCFRRVKVGDRDIKVDIFDMAGQPFFAEVCIRRGGCGE